jgi:hypothetical protein
MKTGSAHGALTLCTVVHAVGKNTPAGVDVNVAVNK